MAEAVLEVVLENLSSLIHKELEELLPNAITNLSSLKTLIITGFPKFNQSEGFQYLTCLECLGISGSSKMEGLHEVLQNLTALQSLSLSNLPNLESLPSCLGNLGLLRSLNISQCPKLKCLPMSIQCLTSLELLHIHKCEELGKRCLKETGEDWPKIAHVQYIQIF